MIDLESEYWAQLDHAYGNAQDIPELLRQLYDHPTSNDPNAEPFFSLWSALCHQGDCYSASYAAVPHIVQAADRGLDRVNYEFVLLPTAIEIARRSGRGPEVSRKLEESYEDAIRKLPRLAVALLGPDSNETLTLVASAAVAVSSGHPKLADVILSLEGDAIDDYLEWYENR